MPVMTPEDLHRFLETEFPQAPPGMAQIATHFAPAQSAPAYAAAELPRHGYVTVAPVA